MLAWRTDNVSIIAYHSWVGFISCVDASDVDHDGRMEIITAGGCVNASGVTPCVRVWFFDGENLCLKGEHLGKFVNALSVANTDDDEEVEIVGVGISSLGDASLSQIFIFSWNDKIRLDACLNCSTVEGGRLNSIDTADLDGNGVAEIVAVGYSGAIEHSHGLLMIWRFDGSDFRLMDKVEWQKVVGGYSVDVAGNPLGNTVASKVLVDDVDGDAAPEIVTCGFSYDGQGAEGQLRIWNWSYGKLNLEVTHEWKSNDMTHATSVSIGDLDCDGVKEIMTSGYTAGFGSWAPNSTGKSRAELRIWRWNGGLLNLMGSISWNDGEAEAAWNVGVGDIDGNDVPELITVGCMEVGNLCDPDLRVWSIIAGKENTESQLSSCIVFVVAIIPAIMILVFAIYRRKAEKTLNSA